MLSLFKSILLHPKNIVYEGVDSDEHVVYVFRKSLITTVPWVTACLVMLFLPNYFVPFLEQSAALNNDFRAILGLFWYLFIFGFFLQSFLNWFFNVYIVTNKKVVDVDFRGLFYSNISEATLDDVEDVTSNVSGALRLVFNFGDVYVQTAAEAREFEFKDVANPAKVRDLIADLIAGHAQTDD